MQLKGQSQAQPQAQPQPQPLPQPQLLVLQTASEAKENTLKQLPLNVSLKGSAKIPVPPVGRNSAAIKLKTFDPFG